MQYMLDLIKSGDQDCLSWSEYEVRWIVDQAFKPKLAESNRHGRTRNFEG